MSEEDSPRKHDSQEERQHNARSARIRCGAPCYRDLNEELNNMKDEEKREKRKGFKESYIAYRARVAREDDTPVTKSMVYSRMQGGRGTETDSLMDTGCTYPLTTTAVTEAQGIEVKPLTGSLEIIDTSGKALKILGTTRMFIHNRILGGGGTN